jgi:hypothetical protein
MNFFKTPQKGGKANALPTHARQEALRQQRLAHEETQKAAGLWGEMSVGIVRWNNDVFVHCWKGKAAADLYKLGAKKPREMTPAEYDALAAWFKAKSYAGFEQSFVAWNVSAEEATRIKTELIAKQRSDGRTIVNPVADLGLPDLPPTALPDAARE